MMPIAPPAAVTAPGALMNLGGVNLGPTAQAAPAAGSPLPRSLSGTYVSVEGIRTLKFEAPPTRSRGVMVKDAAELVAALQQRGVL